MTERAFENAITTVYAMGGSTNMYLHLLAIAREAQVPIGIERIQAIGEKVPLLANLQPHGPYAMTSLHAIGGVPVVMKELLSAGFLHGDVMTVTGKTLAENLLDVPTLDRLRASGHRPSGQGPDRAAQQPHQRAQGQSRARELPAEALRQDPGEGRVPRHRARLRVRGRHDEGDPRRRDRARHRHRRAQCRPGRRPRHAGDGDADHPAAGPRPRRGRGADHRRPLLRRQSRHPDRPHLARGGARAGRSRRCATATRSSSIRRSAPSTSTLPDTEIARRMAAGKPAEPPVRPGSVHHKYVRLVSSAHYGCVV